MHYLNFVLTSQGKKPSIQYILVDREIEGIPENVSRLTVVVPWTLNLLS